MLQRTDVVVFDFDGTLSASDTNYEFFKYCFKHSVRPWFFIPHVIAGSIGRVLNKDGVWWRQTIRKFLTPAMVRDFSRRFVKRHRINRFFWAKEQVLKEKKAGNKVVLITASPDYLIPQLVKDMKFDAILTSRMDPDEPWKYKFMCWGKNKVIAMDRWARDQKYIPNLVRAYSDSKSDMPIMEIAKEQVWIDNKTGLRK